MFVFTNNKSLKRKASFSLFVLVFVLIHLSSLVAKQDFCPGVDDPPPPVLNPDIPRLVAALESLRDADGRVVWKTSEVALSDLRHIFESKPAKTKLEQFFQLLFLIQRQGKNIPVVVRPPGITDVLLKARVFTNPSFPAKITSVTLKKNGNGILTYQVQFEDPEVRFPINRGKGFATWEQGMCQRAKELVFYPGFSFQVRRARNSRNLVVDNFDKVQIFGEFGTRRIFSIDLNYVDLEKVEFVEGTDQGKVKSRVADREFLENKHSRLFKFVGTLIPNTSQQRIDW